MQTIRWGIIGCGNVTEVKSGPAFNKVPDSLLLAVMRRDVQKLQDYVQRHKVPLSFTDANALIQHPEINAIYIATPPDVREAYAIQAMKAGKPVYLEKPMALDVEACVRLKKLSEQLQVKLSVAHYRRALPLFVEVKKMLQAQIIGKVHRVNITMLKNAVHNANNPSNWRVNPKIAGGGYFYDLAPHQLDLIFYFFGKAISYKGKAQNQAGLYAAEDTVQGEIILENNIICKGVWDFTVDKSLEKDSFEIIGDHGTIVFPVFGNSIVLTTAGETKEIHFEPPQHNQQNHINNVVQYFLGNAENPCSASDAIQSMEVMEAFVYKN
jgi:predicted dehydrogenase